MHTVVQILLVLCLTNGETSLLLLFSHPILSDSLRPRGLYTPRNCLGQNTGEGSLSLLQGIFLLQGLNPGLLHFKIYIGWRVFFSAEPSGKQVITSLGYSKVLNLESGTREILTGDVNIQAYVIIAHMIMEWPCSQRRKKSLSKSS